MSLLAEFWDEDINTRTILKFNEKQTFQKLSEADARALSKLLTDKCGCLMLRNVIVPDIEVEYEIYEIIGSECLELVNEYLTRQQSLGYIEEGKSHAQSTFKPYAKDRAIDNDLQSYTNQLSAQQALSLMRDQSHALRNIFTQLELITQKLVI